MEQRNQLEQSGLILILYSAHEFSIDTVLQCICSIRFILDLSHRPLIYVPEILYQSIDLRKGHKSLSSYPGYTQA